MELTNEQVENLVHEPIVSFKMGSGSEKGDNVSSDLYRLEVNCKSGQVHKLVYKVLPTDHPEQRAYAIQGGIFRRENNFYETFVPALKSLIVSKSKSKVKNVDLPLAKFYAGFNDDENDFVCLEDLRPLGFKMPNKFVGLTYPETSLAMKKLAQFHALSYFYMKFEGEGIFERLEPLKIYLQKHWVYSSNKEQYEEYKKFFQAVYKDSVDVIESLETQDGKLLVEKMKGNNLLERVYELIVTTTSDTDQKYFPLLIHGDFWSNNLLFSYDQENKPNDIKFVDFQFCRRGNIYEDINYFVYTSTTPTFREQYLINVLDDYYKSFVETLRDFDCPLPIGWTKGKFLDEFFQNILPAYLFLAFALPLQLGEEEEEGNVKEAEYSDELKKIMKRSPKAVQRLEEVTREMIKLNIL